MRIPRTRRLSARGVPLPGGAIDHEREVSQRRAGDLESALSVGRHEERGTQYPNTDAGETDQFCRHQVPHNDSADDRTTFERPADVRHAANTGPEYKYGGNSREPTHSTTLPLIQRAQEARRAKFIGLTGRRQHPAPSPSPDSFERPHSVGRAGRPAGRASVRRRSAHRRALRPRGYCRPGRSGG